MRNVKQLKYPDTIFSYKHDYISNISLYIYILLPSPSTTKYKLSESNNLVNEGDTGIETTTSNVQLETTTNVEFENIENLVETFNIDIRKR